MTSSGGGNEGGQGRPREGSRGAWEGRSVRRGDRFDTTDRVTPAGRPERTMLVDTVAVICDAESHWYRVWKIAMFYRPAGEVEWHETRLTGGGRNEQKEWRAPRADMVFSRDDFDTWLARYEEVPEVAMHFPRNYVTDQP